jgi:hypothetical protein
MTGIVAVVNAMPEARLQWTKAGVNAKNQQILNFCGLITHKDRGKAAFLSLRLSPIILGC